MAIQQFDYSVFQEFFGNLGEKSEFLIQYKNHEIFILASSFLKDYTITVHNKTKKIGYEQIQYHPIINNHTLKDLINDKNTLFYCIPNISPSRYSLHTINYRNYSKSDLNVLYSAEEKLWRKRLKKGSNEVEASPEIKFLFSSRLYWSVVFLLTMLVLLNQFISTNIVFVYSLSFVVMVILCYLIPRFTLFFEYWIAVILYITLPMILLFLLSLVCCSGLQQIGVQTVFIIAGMGTGYLLYLIWLKVKKKKIERILNEDE